ncbi:GPW/gp25 family protein [Rhodococcus sp. T2V]|uniref:GPW/gp25 family protein n=1 Tax=Rhodococcus sp. T2V TaxID=3034164 RepID=UPI0023E201F9|nr:GPW/gp25 family protein [Rhodococcus sp. T2V]MDF3308900.1 GPW/gp25 family protein [Rhodococcus sp. T2V]
MAPNLHYPYQFDGRGHTRTEAHAEWIRGLVEQVLFTAPGERVMRPDFGSGLRQLIFAPNSDELAATTQVLAQGALQQGLGDLIILESLQVQATGETLTVTVRYLVRLTGEPAEHTFDHGGVA